MALGSIFSSLAGLFLLIGIGWFAVRAKIVPLSASAPFSSLLMKITLPATIFVSELRPYDPTFLTDGLLLIALGGGFFCLYAVVSRLIVPLLHIPDGRKGTWCFCSTFCNNSFMGFPIALTLLGEDGLALAVILAIPFNLLVYSLGAHQILQDCPDSHGKQKIPWGKVIFSPVNAALVLGLVFYCTQLTVPSTILTPLEHLSNATVPLSMFVTGMTLAKSRFADLLQDRDSITSALARLIAYPLLTWLILLILPFQNPLVPQATLVILSMPVPVIATVLAEQHRGNPDLAARSIFFSSLGCFATVPVIAILIQFL